jgi:hypothetical protein
VPAGQFGELLTHVELKVLDEGPAQRLPNLKAFLGTPAIDAALDLEQHIDPTYHLDRDRRQRVSLSPAGGM